MQDKDKINSVKEPTLLDYMRKYNLYAGDYVTHITKGLGTIVDFVKTSEYTYSMVITFGQSKFKEFYTFPDAIDQGYISKASAETVKKELSGNSTSPKTKETSRKTEQTHGTGRYPWSGYAGKSEVAESRTENTYGRVKEFSQKPKSEKPADSKLEELKKTYQIREGDRVWHKSLHSGTALRFKKISDRDRKYAYYIYVHFDKDPVGRNFPFYFTLCMDKGTLVKAEQVAPKDSKPLQKEISWPEQAKSAVKSEPMKVEIKPEPVSIETLEEKQSDWTQKDDISGIPAFFKNIQKKRNTVLFMEGDFLFHKVWGWGYVSSVIGEEDDRTYLIQFGQAKVKLSTEELQGAIDKERIIRSDKIWDIQEDILQKARELASSYVPPDKETGSEEKAASKLECEPELKPESRLEPEEPEPVKESVPKSEKHSAQAPQPQEKQKAEAKEDSAVALPWALKKAIEKKCRFSAYGVTLLNATERQELLDGKVLSKDIIFNGKQEKVHFAILSSFLNEEDQYLCRNPIPNPIENRISQWMALDSGRKVEETDFVQPDLICFALDFEHFSQREIFWKKYAFANLTDDGIALLNSVDSKGLDELWETGIFQDEYYLYIWNGIQIRRMHPFDGTSWDEVLEERIGKTNAAFFFCESSRTKKALALGETVKAGGNSYFIKKNILFRQSDKLPAIPAEPVTFDMSSKYMEKGTYYAMASVPGHKTYGDHDLHGFMNEVKKVFICNHDYDLLKAFDSASILRFLYSLCEINPNYLRNFTRENLVDLIEKGRTKCQEETYRIRNFKLYWEYKK